MNKTEQDSLLDRAVALRQSGKPEAAAGLLRSSQGDLCGRVPFWLLLGDMQEEEDGFAAGLYFYREAVKLAPRHELASRRLFHALWNLGRQGDHEAESGAIAEIRRFTALADSEWYTKIIADLHAKRDILWPDPDE